MVGCGELMSNGEGAMVGKTYGTEESTMTLVAGVGRFGVAFGGDGCSMIGTPLLQTAPTLVDVLLAEMVVLDVVGFITMAAEVGFAKETLQGRQGIVVFVVVQDAQQFRALSVGETSVTAMGIHHQDGVILHEGRCCKAFQFLRAARST